ncbi:MAG: ABC transporter substrate-binding protein [Deinococcota bacterium]
MKQALVLLGLVVASFSYTQSEGVLTDAFSLLVVSETTDTRVIRHLYGETEIPTDLQRIITMQDQNGLLPLLELGEGSRVAGSIGSLRADGTSFFRRTQNFDTSNVTYIGSLREPSLEVMTALNPDLIVGSQVEISEEQYALYSQIAPTVIVEQFIRSIWASLFDYALLTNAQDEAVALKAAYDERVVGIQATLDNASEIEVSLALPGNPGNASLFFESSPHNSFVQTITDVGLSLTPFKQQVIESGEFTEISIEDIKLVDGDVIYLYDLGSRTQEFVDSPLYDTLEAVQKGQAHLVDIQRFAGLSPQALNAWLDVYEETLLVADLDTSWEPSE